MPIKLLHRVLFKELSFLLVLILGSILGLALVVRLLQLGDRFFSQDISIVDIGELMLYLTPFFLFLLIPLGCMLSIFLTLLRMNTDRELTALKSGGVSIYQLLPMPLLICMICVAANYWISFYGLGWGMSNFYRQAVEMAKKKTQLMMQPGTFNQDIPGITLYARSVDPQTGMMRSIFVRDETRGGNPATITASRGEIKNDLENLQMLFVLEDGNMVRQENEETSVLGFEQYVLRLDLNKLMGFKEKSIKKPAEMNWDQLFQIPENKKDDPEFMAAVATEKSKRILLPLSSLILGLLALPLAFVFSGLRRQYGLVLALGIFFAYFTIFSLGSSLSSAQVLSPFLALWTPNIILIALALWWLKLTAGERKPALFTWLTFQFRREPQA